MIESVRQESRPACHPRPIVPMGASIWESHIATGLLEASHDGTGRPPPPRGRWSWAIFAGGFEGIEIEYCYAGVGRNARCYRPTAVRDRHKHRSSRPRRQRWQFSAMVRAIGGGLLGHDPSRQKIAKPEAMERKNGPHGRNLRQFVFQGNPTRGGMPNSGGPRQTATFGP